jgi:hypothetical protein
MPEQTRQPQISADYASYVQAIADQIERDGNPERAAQLRASIQGYEPPAATPDPRSPQQRVFDQRMGITLTPDGRPELPPTLAEVIEREAATQDSKAVDAELAAAGIEPTTARAAAAMLLQQVGSPVKVDQLNAHSISQVAIYAAHIARWEKGRPQ